MYRVELKGLRRACGRQIMVDKFLMYRVELKVVNTSLKSLPSGTAVPNVPCGVESRLTPPQSFSPCFVPNAPCGAKSLELKEKGLNF